MIAERGGPRGGNRNGDWGRSPLERAGRVPNSKLDMEVPIARIIVLPGPEGIAPEPWIRPVSVGNAPEPPKVNRLPIVTEVVPLKRIEQPILSTPPASTPDIKAWVSKLPEQTRSNLLSSLQGVKKIIDREVREDRAFLEEMAGKVRQNVQSALKEVVFNLQDERGGVIYPAEIEKSVRAGGRAVLSAIRENPREILATAVLAPAISSCSVPTVSSARPIGSPNQPTSADPSPFPSVTPTPESRIGVQPLVIVCPNPAQTGDQKYPLSQYTPRMQGIVEYKNINDADIALASQLDSVIKQRFGPNDLVICSPAFGEGVSPVISVYPYDNAGGGNFKWYVMLEDGRLVGPQEDRLFTADNKWVQTNDVAHYSLGRVGEGKFDSMVYVAPRKTALDPEIIVGILDRQVGRVLAGQEMIDRYGKVFSSVPYAALASLDQFKVSIPKELQPSVDHFGYVPTPTPDGKTGLRLAALRGDGTIVFALGQETPKATLTPTPPVTPSPTVTETATPSPSPTVKPTEAPTATPYYPAEWAIPPEGSVHFSSDMANLDRGRFPAYGDRRQGADFQTGNTEYGSGLLAWSVGEPQLDPSIGDKRRRGYVTFYPGDFDGAHSVSIDLLVDKNIKPDYLSENRKNRPWLSVLSIYGKDKESKAVATATVNIESTSDGGYKTVLYRVNLNGSITKAKVINNSLPFELGKKYKIEVVIGNDRIARLYQTDLSKPGDKPSLLSYQKIDDAHLLAFKGGHGGIYSGTLDNVKVWNGNLAVKKLQ